MNGRRKIRITKLGEQEGLEDEDLRGVGPGGRIEMVERITRDAYAFRGESELVERRLQRHVVGLSRRGS